MKKLSELREKVQKALIKYGFNYERLTPPEDIKPFNEYNEEDKKIISDTVEAYIREFLKTDRDKLLSIYGSSDYPDWQRIIFQHIIKEYMKVQREIREVKQFDLASQVVTRYEDYPPFTIEHASTVKEPSRSFAEDYVEVGIWMEWWGNPKFAVKRWTKQLQRKWKRNFSEEFRNEMEKKEQTR